jgi:hypothetical protein
MAPVCARYAILSPQMRAHTRSDSFLANVKMNGSRQIAGLEVGGQPLLNLADEEHRPKERKLFRRGQIDGCHSVFRVEINRLKLAGPASLTPCPALRADP